MQTPGKTVKVRDPQRTASTPCVPRRAYSRLRIRRRLIPLLAGMTLTSGLALTAIAYAGMRAYASPTELGIMLLLVALLETALAVVCGLRFSGAPSNASLDRLDARLNDVACSAADLEQLVRAQVGRSQRQERLARQVNDSARELNTLMEAVEQGQAALRETASEIWAGMSQPGQTLDPATATRLARQSAVVAGRIGSATEDARDRCRFLIGMMNQVIAEGRVLGDEGRVLEARAGTLRTSIERVEMTLGAKVVGRQYDLPGNPFARGRDSRQPTPLAGNTAPTAYPRPAWQPDPSANQLPPPNSASHPGIGSISGLFQLNALLDEGSQSGQWPGPSAPSGQPRQRIQTSPLPAANPSSATNPASDPATNPVRASQPPKMPPQGQPPASAGRGDPARRISRPLWSDTGLRTPSFPGGSLPGISLPGVSLSGKGPSLHQSLPGASQVGFPPLSNSSSQFPRQPAQPGDWRGGQYPTADTGKQMLGANDVRPWWAKQLSSPSPKRPPSPPQNPLQNPLQYPTQNPRQNQPPASQPPTNSSSRWSPDGAQPPTPPNDPHQPGPGRDAPNTSWLND